jgi:antirestriction protein ArdC
MNIDLDEDDALQQSEDQPGPSKPIVFDESVFNADDLEGLSDEEDDENPDVEAEVESKLKI